MRNSRGGRQTFGANEVQPNAGLLCSTSLGGAIAHRSPASPCGVHSMHSPVDFPPPATDINQLATSLPTACAACAYPWHVLRCRARTTPRPPPPPAPAARPIGGSQPKPPPPAAPLCRRSTRATSQPRQQADPGLTHPRPRRPLPNRPVRTRWVNARRYCRCCCRCVAGCW